MEFSGDQASSRIELDDGRVLTKCDQCRQMYSERTPPGEPPCATCWVDLKEENEDAARIFRVVRGQYIVFGERVVDLNFQSVKVIMDLYNIRDQKACFEKVLNIFHRFLKEKDNKENK